MKIRAPRFSFIVCSAFLVVIAGLGAHTSAAGNPLPQANSSAQAIVLSVDPAQSEIHFTLDTTLHTVHGTFKVKSGEIRVEPASGKASGEIIADATTAESGNDSRDKKMHNDVLESPKYPDIVFHPDRVEGQVARSGASNIQLHGIFTLHGADHEMTVPVQANLDGGHWKGSSKFAIPFLQWGLKNPSNFLLKVKPDVNLDLELAGSLRNPAS
jgi:polyisoprenoid-binding protein YceI